MAIEKRIRQDGKPSYLVRIAAKDPLTDRRQNKTIGTYHTIKAAEKAERDALVAQERGTLVDPSKLTVGELLADWLKGKAATISPNSHKDYEIAIRRHLKPALGLVLAQRLTPATVQAQYGAWQDAGMSPRMVHRCHLVLSQTLAQAVRLGTLSRNVCDNLDKPSIGRAKPNVWTPAETAAFLDEAKRDTMAPLWFLLALEGMRRGEALGLRWADVNWDRGSVHISQTVAPDKTNKGAAVIQARTKTNAGARSVKLTAETLVMLAEHRDRQRFQRQVAGERWQDHDLIVCTGAGTPINPNNVTRSYNRLVVLSGVPRVRVHDLRHGAATMLLRAGVAPKIVSERLGHATVAITLDTYSHVLPDMQDVAASAMSAMLAKARQEA
jgi:integrase